MNSLAAILSDRSIGTADRDEQAKQLILSIGMIDIVLNWWYIGALVQAIPRCPLLTIIDLSGDRMGKGGCIALAEAIPHFPSLKNVLL
jgi:hypothetical protein